MNGCGRGFVVERGDNTREISPRLAQLAAALTVRRCRVCGCTDDRACPGGCSWVEPDLCSACAARDADQGARAIFAAALYWHVTETVVETPPLYRDGDSIWRWLRCLDRIAEDMVNA